MAAILFVLLGGRELMSRRIDPDDPDTLDDDLHRGGASIPARGTGTTTETPTQALGVRRDQILTLIAFVLVALIALAFEKNIGFVAITAAVILAMLAPNEHKDAVKQIAWPTVLLVAGVSTYATILTTAGSPEFVGKWAAGLGAVAVGALILCYVGGVVSAFASSTALLPVIIPIGVPLIADGGISAGHVRRGPRGVVDHRRRQPLLHERCAHARQQARLHQRAGLLQADPDLRVIVTLAGPLLVWAALVLPGWGS